MLFCVLLSSGLAGQVSVRERKGIKWRKGLLRRKHGDGSWTVRHGERIGIETEAEISY